PRHGAGACAARGGGHVVRERGAASMRVRVFSSVIAALFVAACGTPAQPPAATQPAQQQQQAAASGNVVFFSNQFHPVEEQSKMQDVILKSAPVKSDFIPEDPGPFNDRMTSEQ